MVTGRLLQLPQTAAQEASHQRHGGTGPPGGGLVVAPLVVRSSRGVGGGSGGPPDGDGPSVGGRRWVRCGGGGAQWVVVGCPLSTIGMVSGAGWADEAWGGYWGACKCGVGDAWAGGASP